MMEEENVKKLMLSIAHQWGYKAENVLQILIQLQQKLNFIPPSSIPFLASQLQIEPVDIEAVIEFYSFLNSNPPNQYSILFSDNIIDQFHGSRELAQQLAKQLNIGIGQSDHQLVSIDYTSCIGLSDQAPSALANHYSLANLNSQKIEQIAALIKQQKPIEQWPQALFKIDLNIRQELNLLKGAFDSGLAIQSAIQLEPQQTLEILKQSGLRGCGGAGFSVAKKWQFCAEIKANQRVVVCNADEGEPGTFKDRVLLQHYAEQLIEGMTVCAATIGAELGFIYLRGEYYYLLESLNECLVNRRKKRLLGKNILSKQGFDFDIQIHLGAGAYICGEESALIESLEGKRGIPRIRPPFPVTSGYLNKPTVVNNVETFVLAAMVILRGAKWLNQLGTQFSKGTKLLSISGDCDLPGVYEFEYGVTINDILTACDASQVKAIQVGGPAGQLLVPNEFDRQLSFEDVATGGSFMVFNESRDLLKVVENFTQFFQHESCGFCTPCRVGCGVLVNELDDILANRSSAKTLEAIQQVGELMQQTSHCGLGQTAANPLLQSIQKFPKVYQSYLKQTGLEPHFDLDASLEQSRRLTGRKDQLLMQSEVKHDS